MNRQYIPKFKTFMGLIKNILYFSEPGTYAEADTSDFLP